MLAPHVKRPALVHAIVHDGRTCARFALWPITTDSSMYQDRYLIPRFDRMKQLCFCHCRLSCPVVCLLSNLNEVTCTCPMHDNPDILPRVGRPIARSIAQTTVNA